MPLLACLEGLLKFHPSLQYPKFCRLDHLSFPDSDEISYISYIQLLQILRFLCTHLLHQFHIQYRIFFLELFASALLYQSRIYHEIDLKDMWLLPHMMPTSSVLQCPSNLIFLSLRARMAFWRPESVSGNMRSFMNCLTMPMDSVYFHCGTGTGFSQTISG